MIPRESADQFEDSFWMQDTRGVQCLSESLLPDSSRSYSNAGAMSWKGEHHYLRCCNQRRARGSSTKELAAEIWDTHTQHRRSCFCSLSSLHHSYDTKSRDKARVFIIDRHPLGSRHVLTFSPWEVLPPRLAQERSGAPSFIS